MSRTALAVIALALVVSAGASGASVPDRGAGNDSAAEPRIAAVYPNPVAPRDAGEFVVLRVPPGTDLGTFRLRDDDATAVPPNVTAGGRVVLSTAPGRTRALTEGPVYRLSGRFRLANAGERLWLRRDGRAVDAVTYADAPEGELRRATADGPAWHPLGATRFPVVHGKGGTVRTFVLPDAPGLPVEFLRSADRRILLAGYTLSSERVVHTLRGAARRGVRVRVLVDGTPVGGATAREARALDALAAAGVEVSVLSGNHTRYRYHHAKYAVVEDRAVVTTENWKPAGIGGRSSRGWGVVLTQPAVVSGLAETFRADAGWLDSLPWTTFREGRTFEPGSSANGTYPARFEPRRFDVKSVRLLRAPDNAERATVELLGAANRTLLVEQVSVGGRDQPFLRAAVRAARRGVEVRILLGGAWYVRGENRELAAWLNGRAQNESLPLGARVATPRGRFEKIHAKGAVIDGERVVLGSMNWNNNSARANREVAVVLEGEEVAEYYARVFRADWRGGAWRLSVGLVGAVALGSLAAVAAGRRVEFGNRARAERHGQQEDSKPGRVGRRGGEDHRRGGGVPPDAVRDQAQHHRPVGDEPRKGAPVEHRGDDSDQQVGDGAVRGAGEDPVGDDAAPSRE